MIKWIKGLFTVSSEDRQLANTIKQLCKNHDVTVSHSDFGGWCVSVKRKKQ